MVDSWNKLPSKVVNAPSLNSFKNRLDKAWAKHMFSTNIQFPLPPQVIDDDDMTSDEEKEQIKGLQT